MHPTSQEQSATSGRASGRVHDPVPGLYSSIDTGTAPPGWKIDGRVHTDSSGLRIVTSNVEAPNGKKGWIERSYDPKKKQVVMDNAFLDELPSWIDAGTPLVPGKGTPLVAYLTLRQMKQLGAEFGAAQSFKMSTIQNIDAVAHLKTLVGTNRDVVALSSAIRQTHSVKYATTAIEQSGHTIVDVRLDPTNAWEWSLKEAMDHFRWPRDRRDALLQKYGLQETDETLFNFDIIIEVAPHPRNPQP